MQGILKEIYDYKVDLINHLKAKETQKSLESKILNSKKSRGFINKIENNINLKYLYRKFDQMTNQYCNKGFFNFKKFIPKILSKLDVL